MGRGRLPDFGPQRPSAVPRPPELRAGEGSKDNECGRRHRGGLSELSFYLAAAGLLLVVAAYAIADAVLAPTPIGEISGFIDVLPASHAVVAAIRIAIIFAAAFIVASIVALVARRQWLTGSEADDRLLRDLVEVKTPLDQVLDGSPHEYGWLEARRLIALS